MSTGLIKKMAVHYLMNSQVEAGEKIYPKVTQCLTLPPSPPPSMHSYHVLLRKKNFLQVPLTIPSFFAGDGGVTRRDARFFDPRRGIQNGHETGPIQA